MLFALSGLYSRCFEAYSGRAMRCFLGIFIVSLTSLTTALCAIQAPPPPAPSTDTPSSMAVAEARKKLEHGEIQQAIDELRQLAEAQPAVRGANRELAIAYYRTGDLNAAERTFATAMLEDPTDVESVQMRGLTLYRLGRSDAAIPYLERSRQWTPNANVDANYVLGLCYMRARRYDDARSMFATQYGVNAGSGSAYLLLAQMLLHDDLPELAAENAHRALEASPQIPLAHLMLGKALLSKSDLVHALEQFELERKINAAYPPVYEWLGDVYTRMAQYQQAQESLTKAISLDQSSTGPYILMGKVFLRDSDPQTAATYLEHAEQMDSGNYITHYLLGQAYKEMGRADDAKREIDAVSKLQSASRPKLQSVQ
jgi:tetratricopeptide (TPR) repeat protein